MASYTKAAQQWATFARAWYLLDAKMQPPGKIAAATVIRLEGRHKPIYHALSDCGDHVVIINTRHIAFSGNKWEQKVYSSHTGYPGGFKQVTATQLHLKDPTANASKKPSEENYDAEAAPVPGRCYSRRYTEESSTRDSSATCSPQEVR
ncbi:large ribosomal subunit protein uL13m isoform 3-T3 [Morus bassanus]